MPRVRDVTAYLDAFAPPATAEPWDNIGLLLGDPATQFDRALTCLTLTSDVAAEAVRDGFGLIVTHHPILFRPVQRLTADTSEGTALLTLIAAGVAVYSPHTAFDNAVGGVNDQLAERLGLTDLRPLRFRENQVGPAAHGAGRRGTLKAAVGFGEFAATVKEQFGLSVAQAVPTDRLVRRVGVACGAAAEYLADADRAGCDVFVTGEARFHAAVEARTRGVGLILLGHYASERFAVETLADRIAEAVPGLTVQPSRVEHDPLVWC